MNLQQMEVLRYFIPHEGMITILESGSIEIVNDESTRTIIPVSEGVKYDFREIINSRMTGAEKVVNLVRENPGVVASTACRQTCQSNSRSRLLRTRRISKRIWLCYRCLLTTWHPPTLTHNHFKIEFSKNLT